MNTPIAYEVFIQSFCDSNGDGIGDLPGLTSKLDYLEDLGVDMLWLSPVHPSPSYHKYDVTDYYGIHPDYGTKADFQNLVTEAHKRGIKIILDLVLNHCSKLHPWFLQALNPNSKYRDYFIWETPEQIKKTGSFTKEESADSDNVQLWHRIPSQDEHYYAFFWSGMPDLNYDNPEVREEMFNMAIYWLSEMDVDGFRLDAAKHIFPEHRKSDIPVFWKDFKTKVSETRPNAFLIGEVWSDLTEQAPYASGFDSLFNFDLAVSILESTKKGHLVGASVYKKRWKIDKKSDPVHIYLKSESAFHKTNTNFLQASFLSNHDQDRTMSFLKHDPAKAKLAASIYLTLPGIPFIYYGEELGMKGKKPDEHIREPFNWEANSNENTQWVKIKYNNPGQVASLEDQVKDKDSILHHYKKLIAFRRENTLIRNGRLEKAEEIKDPEILAYYRLQDESSCLVLHNLSKKTKSIAAVRSYTNVCFRTGYANIDKLGYRLPPQTSLILTKPHQG